MPGRSVRRMVQVIGIVMLSFSLGCDIGRMCTLIGCVNGLFVRFPTSASKPFRIEITNSVLGAVHVYECKDLVQCTNGASFEDFFPRSATIKVITATGSTTTLVSPEYVESYPNGKGCGPACSSATVTVPFPVG